MEKTKSLESEDATLGVIHMNDVAHLEKFDNP